MQSPGSPKIVPIIISVKAGIFANKVQKAEEKCSCFSIYFTLDILCAI